MCMVVDNKETNRATTNPLETCRDPHMQTTLLTSSMGTGLTIIEAADVLSGRVTVALHHGRCPIQKVAGSF